MKKLLLIIGMFITLFATINVANAAVTFPVNGGTGTSTKPVYGQVLVGDNNGLYNLVSTSSLGITSPVTSVFGRIGVIIAQAGDYTTAQVTEVTNLYFTAARVLGTALTGFVSTTGTVTSSDTVLTALEKLAGNVAAIAGYPFPLAGNATSTLTQFNGGLTAYASSTIGDGTQTGGLTVNGGATTTNLIIKSITGSTQCLHVNSAGLITGTGADCGTGSGGVTSVTATYPLSSSGGSTPVISSATSSATSAGVLSAADWTTFNNKQSALTFSYPLQNSGGAVSVAYGTTTTNIWSNLQTFNGGFNSTAASTILNPSTTQGAGTYIGQDLTHGVTIGYYNSNNYAIWPGGITPGSINYGILFANSGASTQYNSTNNLEFNINDSTKMLVNSSGNVGIASTTPGSVLSVGTTGGTNIYDNSTTTKSGTGGYSIASGCFAVGNTCLSSGAIYTGTYPIVITGSVISTPLATTSIQQTYGTPQIGAITIATTSTSFNGLTVADAISNSGGTFTITPLWSGTLNNAGLTNSSLTVNNTSISLGSSGTITAASSTLLSDNNVFAGLETFIQTIVGNITGNAGTATKLQTPQNINNVAFDGSGSITITAASSTLLGDNNTFSGALKLTGATTTSALGFNLTAGCYAIGGACIGAGGGGGVTSIIAGTGLTGGTITTSGTIALSTPVSAANGGTGVDLSGSSGVIVDNAGTLSASTSLAVYRGGTGLHGFNSSATNVILLGNNTTLSTTTLGSFTEANSQIFNITHGTNATIGLGTTIEADIPSGQILSGSPTGIATATSTITISKNMHIGFGTSTPDAYFSFFATTSPATVTGTLNASTSFEVFGAAGPASSGSTGGNGGGVFFQTGIGGAGLGGTSGGGGTFTIITGAGQNGSANGTPNAGAINLTTGGDNGSGTGGGDINLTTGAGSDSGATGGSITITAGGGTASAGTSGNILLKTAKTGLTGVAGTITMSAGGIGTTTLSTKGNFGVATSTPWRTFSVLGTVAMDGLTTSAAAQASTLCRAATNDVVAESVACGSSARRYKYDINDLSLSDDLNQVLALQPVTYLFKPDFNNALQSDPNYSRSQVGLIADDTIKVNPAFGKVETATTTFEGKIYAPGAPAGIDYDAVSAALVGAIKEQQVEIDSLNPSGPFRDMQDDWQWGVIGLLILWNLYLTFRKRS